MRATAVRAPIRWLSLALSMAAALSLSAASPAPAASDACGLVTESSLAKALGLSQAGKNVAVLAGPGNSAGVIKNRCRVLAWKGRKPVNARQRRQALVDGTAATLRIRTWVRDPGPNVNTWQQNFETVLRDLRAASQKLFVKTLGGEAFSLPKSGAEFSLGYRAATEKTRRVRGLWWNRSDKTIISMEILEARSRQPVQHLKNVAAMVVSEIG